MDISSIIHRPIKEYIYPRSRTTLALQIFTAARDVEKIVLLYWERYETDPEKIRRIVVPCVYRDDQRDCYRTEIRVDPIAAYIRYSFELHSGGEVYWYGRDGVENEPTQMDGNFYEFLWPNREDGYAVPAWGAEQIYYQIFPERYRNADPSLTPLHADPWGSEPTRDNYMGGDLEGVIQSLDYVSDLGITCLYLTPIFKAGSNHKYDTIDYYEIDPQFGTKETLHRLVQEAHVRDMRILLDGVFNHCGYYFGPFQDLVEYGESSRYKDWFFIHSYPVITEPCNYDCVGHYKWMPKINLSNPETAQYFIDVASYWTREFGIDGWRLDVADELPGSFVEHLSAEMRRQFPGILLLGETWGDAGRLVNGNRLDSAMNYLFKDAVTDWIARGRITASEFNNRINRMYAMYPEEINRSMYNLLDSHDTARFLHECGEDTTRLKLAVALQMTFLGSPAIYYGDEVGITGANDPLCRKAMVWDASAQDLELREWYQYFIYLRKDLKLLQIGEFRCAYVDDVANTYAYYRRTADDSILVILNAGKQETRVQIADGEPDDSWIELADRRATHNDLPASNSSITKYTGYIDCTIPAYSVKILQKKKVEGYSI